jgi:membrane-associated phospholipid phosphatase
LRRAWLTTLAICVVLFEIATVLVLRAHYTMDVFTGGLAAVWVAQVCGAIAERFAPFRIEPAD